MSVERYDVVIAGGGAAAPSVAPASTWAEVGAGHPPLPGRELAITSDNLLFLPEFPRRLVLAGSGLAALAARLGATAQQVATQLSIHPSHGERLIKSPRTSTTRSVTCEETRTCIRIRSNG